jgi:hypothetical protein
MTDRRTHPASAHPSGGVPRRAVAGLALVVAIVSGCSLVGGTPGLDPAALGGRVADLGPVALPAPISRVVVAAPGSLSAPVLPVVLDPPARARGPFSLDLATPDDHVAQYDDSWCVGASMQMMVNIIEPGRPDRSRETQLRLYRIARRTSPWIETRPGASVYGWSEGLEALGHGGYEEIAATTRQDALRLAARQMRLTGRPAGLLVWGGKHAWVMSGFRATRDPAVTDDFLVTHVRIEDPWAGRVSRTWGAGLEPHALVAVEDLDADYVRYASVYRPQYGRRGMYVVVAPVA